MMDVAQLVQNSSVSDCHYPQLTLFGGQGNTCHLGVGMYLQEEKKNMSYK